MQQCNAMWQLRLHDGLILHLLVLHYMWTVKYAMVGGKAEEIKCIQGVPKKMSFLGKTAITTFKIIQNAKAGGVLENSGYLLPDEH